MIANHPICGVISYHVTLSEGHMIANHPYKGTLVPHLVATLICLSQIYSYYIRGDMSPLSIDILHRGYFIYHIIFNLVIFICYSPLITNENEIKCHSKVKN